MHLNSDLLFRKHALPYFRDGMKVLEIGPLGYPSYYNKVVGNPAIQWHTLDIGDAFIDDATINPNHITSDLEYDYPVETDTYDIVLSGQVMEHVKKIWAWAEELNRITRPGGLLILICPISWEYHEVPVDCWRIYPDGMRSLMEETGFEVLECKYGSMEKELVPASTPTLAGTATIPVDRSLNKTVRLIFNWNRVLSRLPIMRKLTVPVTVAYDTICIARKECQPTESRFVQPSIASALATYHL
jgi:SAM-dependent methyltransferase